MELHHDKHHAAYVKGANTALGRWPRPATRATSAPSTSSEGSGLPPGRPRQPLRVLEEHVPRRWRQAGRRTAAAIDEYFGSFDGFRSQFTENANAIQGSGWSILVWDLLGKRLNVMQLFDQQGNLPVAQVPLLELDMWEHARSTCSTRT